jgi:hypothetical protein
MRMEAVTAEMDWSEWLVVRLLRRWAAAGEVGDPIAGLVELAEAMGVAPDAAFAVASLFQLTEAHLARPLVAECCCSKSLAADERAILLLLAAPAGTADPQATRIIPHGLPAALRWAVASVRRLMGLDDQAPAATAVCPFRTGPDGDQGGVGAGNGDRTRITSLEG